MNTNCDAVLNLIFDTRSGQSYSEVSTRYESSVKISAEKWLNSNKQYNIGFDFPIKGLPVRGDINAARSKYIETVQNYALTKTIDFQDIKENAWVEISLPVGVRERAIQAWEKCNALRNQDVYVSITGSFSDNFTVELLVKGINKESLKIENNVNLEGSVKLGKQVNFKKKAKFNVGETGAQTFIRTDVNKSFIINIDTNYGAVVLYGEAKEIEKITPDGPWKHIWRNQSQNAELWNEINIAQTKEDGIRSLFSWPNIHIWFREDNDKNAPKYRLETKNWLNKQEQIETLKLIEQEAVIPLGFQPKMNNDQVIWLLRINRNI